MSLSYEAVDLDVPWDDTAAAMLVFREGVLLAVVSQLGVMHGELAGSWFVEALFNGNLSPPRGTFGDLPELERWIAGRLAAR